MDNRRKKAWLQECWNLARVIDYCDGIINDPSVYSSPGFGERVAGTAGEAENRIARKLAETDQAVKDRDRAIRELEKRKSAINRLKDGTQKKILWLRYIGHYSWADVCLSVSYSRSRVNVLHGRAVESLEII